MATKRDLREKARAAVEVRGLGADQLPDGQVHKAVV